MLNALFANFGVTGACNIDAGYSIVSFAGAPGLLLYSYLPVVAIALLLGFFVFSSSKGDRTARSFFAFALLFSLWVLNIIIQWIGVSNNLIFVSWQMTIVFEIGLYLSALHLFIAFTTQAPLTHRQKTVFGILAFLAIALAPSIFNISGYNYDDCEGVIGSLWYVVYGFEAIVPFVIAIQGALLARRSENRERRTEISIFTAGLAICLAVFGASNMIGEFGQAYSYNLFGPIGMLIFMALMAYLIQRYKIFEARIFKAQILVIVLAALIGSLLLVEISRTAMTLTSITFVLAVVFGSRLVKSVKREIEHREQLEKLRLRLEQSNIRLESANEKLKSVDKLKTEFLSLAAHQLRSPLTAIKGYTSMILEGSFGPVDAKPKEAVNRVFESSVHLAKIVEDLLNVSKIEAGGMKYEMAPFDLEKPVKDLTTDLSITAQKKGLKLIFASDKTGPYMINGDMEKIRQVVLNVIDNAIKYTQAGSITVKLLRNTEKGLLSIAVTDTGMGISAEEKEKLFQKFSRGEGGKTNTSGSGLGLYLAKQIAIAHGGDVAIDSPGVGKGSTFTINLKATA